MAGNSCSPAASTLSLRSIITITITMFFHVLSYSVTSWTSLSPRASCRPGRTSPTTSTMRMATPTANNNGYPMVSEAAQSYFVLLMQKNAAMQKVACDKKCAMTIVCTAITVAESVYRCLWYPISYIYALTKTWMSNCPSNTHHHFSEGKVRTTNHVSSVANIWRYLGRNSPYSHLKCSNH